MASTLKVDTIQTNDGTGTIALQNQLSGMTGASMPAGHILQTVNFVSTNNQVTSTSSSFAATGEEITITPSSTSSKILVIAVWGAQVLKNGSHQAEGEFKIVGTASGDLMKHRYQAYDYGGSGSAQDTTINMTVLDTPSSTSAQTYAIHQRLLSGDAIKVANANMKTNMIAIEIKG